VSSKSFNVANCHKFNGAVNSSKRKTGYSDGRHFRQSTKHSKNVRLDKPQFQQDVIAAASGFSVVAWLCACAAIFLSLNIAVDIVVYIRRKGVLKVEMDMVKESTQVQQELIATALKS
jgi:hypothetical protein